jgi:hypothetical protein
MAETRFESTKRRFMIRHRGRGAQVFIYLGKLLRMFVYQSDWKVLPMAALIAGLVGMVVRRKFFISDPEFTRRDMEKRYCLRTAEFLERIFRPVDC